MTLGVVLKKIALHPVVSKFGGLIVNMFSQSSTQFQRGNFNRSYTTALTVLEGQPSSGVFAKFSHFNGLFEMIIHSKTSAKGWGKCQENNFKHF